MNNCIENFLDICIVTYNRSEYLKKTLEKILSSTLRNCNIYVLDNCSTDETPKVIGYFGTSIKHIRHKFNIGASANILRGYETGDSPYVWVIGDDDDYDFSDVSDLDKILQDGNVDLIHIGAHVDSDWHFGGKIYNTRELVSLGYHYFKYASFIGCNIVKREALSNYMLAGYNNITNAYPHMPYLLSFYEDNKTIYISKRQICRAIVGNQGYNEYQLLTWWSKTCKILKNKAEQKACFFDQYQRESLIYALRMRYRLNRSKSVIDNGTSKIIMSFFSDKNKRLSYILLPLYLGYRYLNQVIHK